MPLNPQGQGRGTAAPRYSPARHPVHYPPMHARRLACERAVVAAGARAAPPTGALPAHRQQACCTLQRACSGFRPCPPLHRRRHAAPRLRFNPTPPFRPMRRCRPSHRLGVATHLGCDPALRGPAMRSVPSPLLRGTSPVFAFVLGQAARQRASSRRQPPHARPVAARRVPHACERGACAIADLSALELFSSLVCEQPSDFEHTHWNPAGCSPVRPLHLEPQRGRLVGSEGASSLWPLPSLPQRQARAPYCNQPCRYWWLEKAA